MLALTEQLSEEELYNEESAQGTYLPNEFDVTCGDSAKFGFIIGGVDAKMGSYPFIAALGT